MKNWFIKLPQVVRILIVVVLYLVFFIAHISVVYYYNNNIAEVIDSKDIVVTTRDVNIHTIVTEDDVAMKSVRLESIVDGAITNINEVIGKESQVALTTNEQMVPTKINSVVKKEGEMIIEMPAEWVISFPKSLRRLDLVNILPVKIPTNNNNRNDMAVSEEERAKQEAIQIAEANILIANAQQMLKELTVAYFKDNTANEITDSNENVFTGEVPRTSSSNLGTRLEIAVSPEQWDIIKGLNELNYKFVVGYE